MGKYCSFLLISLVVGALITGCGGSKEAEVPNVDNIALTVDIERLEGGVFGVKDQAELKLWMDNHPVIAEQFFVRSQYPDDAVFVESIWESIKNPALDTLYQQSVRAFENMATLEAEFTRAFKFIKHYYPDFEPPKVQTVVSGLSRDLLLTDSLIVVSLDFYIGAEAAYRPSQPAYILERYRQEYIVPAVIFNMTTRFNTANPKDRTLIADMVYAGKAYYFMDKVLPYTPDSLIVWYSGQNLADVATYEENIWAYFIQNELLYETEQATKGRFLSERPFVAQIGPKCPGRIGAWVGWQIVQEYASKQPDLTLPALMQEENGRKIFETANYNAQ